ncbi:hypothetical protein ACH474_18110 [Nocardia rhamnosiphila]|uniref:hypothetical protein n=1 Tax=Nocardia rhamnosiphila TaxID=426716 RepID=UPI0004C3F4E7|nr:hypothetical protein [Nocardia rhamnosiphila]
MTESAVIVLIGRERGQYGLGRSVVEKNRQLVAFQDTGTGFEEPPRGSQVDTHAPEARQR